MRGLISFILQEDDDLFQFPAEGRAALDNLSENDNASDEVGILLYSQVYDNFAVGIPLRESTEGAVYLGDVTRQHDVMLT